MPSCSGRLSTRKAKWLGLPVTTVPSRGTSSKCSICDHKMKVEENRTLHCPSCGYMVDRDVNAAKNILEAGRLRFGLVERAGEAMKLSCSNEQVDARQLPKAGLPLT
ncbi:MAG: zinc ribbon domain-containing protein [Candidatus Bathyarchaeia archaeon]